MIKPFPTPSDRDRCNTALQLYASGRWTRQKMMSTIANILDKYGVSQLHIGNFSVKKAEPVRTSLGEFPVVVVIADKQAYERCPVCGHAGCGYLAGEAPEITAWCNGCGSVYRKEVGYERVGESGHSVDMG